MDITFQLEADGSCVRFAEHSVKSLSRHDLEARATIYYKLAKEDSCDPTKPQGGQKVSAYLKRSYNLLDADGAGGTPSTQQNCGDRKR